MSELVNTYFAYTGIST